MADDTNNSGASDEGMAATLSDPQRFVNRYIWALALGKPKGVSRGRMAQIHAAAEAEIAAEPPKGKGG